MTTKTLQLPLYIVILTTLFASSSESLPDTPIPADKSQLATWFQTNVQPFTSRKNTLDPALAAAEAEPKVIKVSSAGSGEFKTVQAAVDSVPSGNTKRVIISIGPGTYNEKIKIDRTKPFITFKGSHSAPPRLTYDGTALKYGTVDSASLIVEADYFVASDLIIANSAPQPDGIMKGAQAVALRVSGDKAAVYGCKVLGFQDTICDDKGRHFFKDCYIEGTVDFIFGSGKSIYLNTEIHVMPVEGFSVITAQAREVETEDTGYSFIHCTITGAGKGTYLGRAWQSRPKVVFAYTNMGNVVNPEGWTNNFKPERDSTVFFGEFKNTGPGAEAAGRAKFTRHFTHAQVKPFLSLAFIEGSKWLLPPPKG